MYNVQSCLIYSPLHDKKTTILHTYISITGLQYFQRSSITFCLTLFPWCLLRLDIGDLLLFLPRPYFFLA